MANETILVVDDEELNRKMLSKRLKRSGYEVFLASNGQEALDTVKSPARIDMVLLDIMMPGMDGFETLQHIREIRNDVELPVIMLTALGDSGSIVKALNGGASDYVTKPINFEILTARMQSRLAIRSAAMAQQQQPFVVEVGTELGNYKLKEELGEGATSVVYLAEDLRLHRKVAVKILKNDFCENDEAMKRFEREAKSIASIDHPGVVGIYEISRKPCCYLAMEYLQGTGMDDIIGDRPLPVEKAVNLTRQIADILVAVHEKKIIHRDLKPQNLIVDNEGQVHLMDFGAAKNDNVNSNLTKAGAIVGTPRYMAPEQLDASFGEICEATDLFPLGLMLYEMLTGLPALHGDSLYMLINELIYRKPCSAAERNPAVPPALDKLCLQLQATKPTERPATSAQVRDELLNIERLLK